MRRSGPLRRGKPLKRSPIRRKPKPKRPKGLLALEEELKAAYVDGVRRERCACCGRAAPTVIVRAHHVLRRVLLEKALRDRGSSPEEILRAAWDRRNRLPVCDFCHGDHHNGLRRISVDLIVKQAPQAVLFARRLDLLPELTRDYQGGHDA